MAFHVALLLFAWTFWVWNLPVTALVALVLRRPPDSPGKREDKLSR